MKSFVPMSCGYFDLLDVYTIRFILRINHPTLMCDAREACRLFASREWGVADYDWMIMGQNVL